MTINFPSNPALNQVYAFDSRSWQWDGAVWRSINLSYGPPGPTGPTGPIGLSVTGPTGAASSVPGPTGPTGSMTLSVNTNTATAYTVALTDADKMALFSATAAIAVTVPTNATAAFAIGTTINLCQYNTGQITITGASGVTVNGTPGLKTRARYSAVSLIKVGADAWVAFGDLAA